MDLETKLFSMNQKCKVQRFHNYRVENVETIIKRNIDGWLMK